MTEAQWDANSIYKPAGEMLPVQMHIVIPMNQPHTLCWNVCQIVDFLMKTIY